ncbi:flagellar hook capping FlgD N-terminal domain-containing protein [Roseomonas sp. E05]|uniref:flagellar hook assembly protein FlgD n=1 Tax=Roseomonas sp. E05 TaxID=3046310 RepID=UPI0024BAA9D2|nr:flagellar hook capping FlgD N-terminal domain-containing protein [Roseomonas sp. E05]MDJ0390391.1 flagellar hook capping FlgD N-terminal domain-containing protein [Roseomonas sp. E05]
MATTSSISGISTASALASTNTAATTQLSGNSSEDYDRFLKLLTAQMKYQDPMQPTDPTQFVAQLAQFSQVEQQTKSNTYLKSILDAVSGSTSLSENAALLGRTVQTQLSQVTLSSAGATVPLTAQVNVGTLTGTRLEVLDASGTVVRKVSLNSGTTELTFDGKDSNGMALAAGTYKVRVVGDDASGARQSAGTVSNSGKITEVRRGSDGAVSLVLENGAEVSATDVTRLGTG